MNICRHVHMYVCTYVEGERCQALGGSVPPSPTYPHLAMAVVAVVLFEG